ncbi:GNAT family N-acetyltransferase [Oceanobacillus oncorhynchi]|uniref:GNAT family N-acetyltransferase n=1 Tax=Oceanobacillus oncorhynchi TaxID=545501 RepID=UPI002115FECC|nr:GNAT family N-acetyltransferase [Oceanobacillus oncorhynchi]UUI39234.1 GNAT family N-acetyltransferase [Oceanobacillus oncorhynchi]
MKHIPLNMLRKNLSDIPQFSLPDGYSIRFYEKGDERHWAKIETSVDEFKEEAAALAYFEKEFGLFTDEMTKRCLFVENEDGEEIATTTAWHGDLRGDGEISGRIHWVGVTPAYQGKKLAKPLMTAAMNTLAEYHSKAYLTTQTTSFQAINMYLNYGFEPYLMEPTCEEGWRLMEQKLERKILKRY